jgi:hypothetical protein
MNNSTDDVLFYTSSLSDHMNVEHHTTAFQGLYMCSLNRETGKCQNPELVVDQWNHNGGTKHHGLRLTNVALDDSKSLLYSIHFEDARHGFEILRAALTRPIEFQSFFRTKGAYSNSDCGLECCAGAGHTYLNMKPRSYLVEGEDIFISWGGLYQDCADEFLQKASFKWTIGVSKLEQRSDCILTGTQVDFADCTTPVALAYQGDQGEDDVFLGYSSFQSSRSPSGNRIFYLSVLKGDSDNMKSQLVNEIWAIPEGEVFAKNPNALQKIDQVPVSRSFMYHSVDNVGSIRLRLDKDGVATSLCTAAYDGGIFCSAFSLDTESRIEVYRTETVVTGKQIKERCTLKASPQFPQTVNVPAVASGLEVVWDEESSEHFPEILFFGCMGEVPDQGNFVTAFRNGTLVQTLDGGFPGSILFGKRIPDSAPADFVPDTSIEPPLKPGTAGDEMAAKKSPKILLLATFVLALIMMSVYLVKIVSKRRREDYMFNRLLQRRHEDTDQDSMQFHGPGAMSSTSTYIELSSTSY